MILKNTINGAKVLKFRPFLQGVFCRERGDLKKNNDKTPYDA